MKVAVFALLLLVETSTLGLALAQVSDKVSQEVSRAKEIVEADQQVKDLKAVAEKEGLKESEKGTLQRAVAQAEERLQQVSRPAEGSRNLQDIADKRFAGFNFGVALGVVVKAGKRDLVQTAAVDPNGIVRIERDNNTTANLLLESHYFYTPQASFLGLVDSRNWGHGPFVAVQPGTENIIQSVGAGWMIGFKRSSIVAQDLARDRGDSFNIGIGVMVNPNAQVLGDGVQKNQPLPSGETSVRLRKTTEMGYLITFSYSF